MVLYTLEQLIFRYYTCVKYESVRKCRRKFRRKFRDERVARRQAIHNLVNKLGSTGPLIGQNEKKQAPYAY
jgi:hypothetical protein